MRTLLAVFLAAFAAAADETPAQRLLAAVEMGKPLVGKSLILFPLRTKTPPETADVVASTRTDALSFAEPEMPRYRHNLLVRNAGDKPVLLPGGTVVVGGHIDRLVRNDHLIGPGATVEIRTLPAAATSDRRKEAVPFRVLDSMAPIYLRRQADFGGTPSLVPSFVEKWIEFRDKGDKRRSLAAIASSSVLHEFCVADCERAGVPDVLKDDRLLGAVSAVRGRVQSLILFSTNDLARAYVMPLVEGASWANAAVVLRARKLGVPVPGDEEPAETLARLTKEATTFLEHVRKARYKPDEMNKGEVGQAWLMRTGAGERGRAVAYKGRAVHVVVYPNDPFESRLYGSRVKALGEDDDPSKAEAPEEFRRDLPGRRMTAAERRYIDRAGHRGGVGGVRRR